MCPLPENLVGLSLLARLSEPGCLSVLLHIEHGPAVQVFGNPANIPPGLIGAKWPDVRTWCVVLWRDGAAAYAILKTETPAPWTLDQLVDHYARHPRLWHPIPAPVA